MTSAIPVYDADQVQRLLPMARCIDLLTDLHIGISRGRVELPLRSAVPLPYGDGSNALLMMPGALPEPATFGAKLLSLYPGNSYPVDKKAQPALPNIQGYVLLFDGSNGSPLALVEAASLTAIRTAAASGAATRALAKPNARSLALLGYGVQAASHLEAMRAVRAIDTVRVWGPDPVKAAAFAARHGDPGLQIEASPTAQAAVAEADIICAVTASKTPVIEGRWLAAGTHLNLVGAHTPETREADAETVSRARVFTEITEFALAEAGDLLLAAQEGVFALDDIAGEIGSVFAGDLSGRENENQITLYKNLGNVGQDLIAAHHVHATAAASG